VLTDGRGVPISLVVAGANVHDVKLLEPTLDGVVVARPGPTEEQQHLCADKGYDGAPARKVIESRGYIPHVKTRGQEKQEKATIPGYRARRWVVERAHSWLNRYRKILVRYEKKVDNYKALLMLACAITAWRRSCAIYG